MSDDNPLQNQEKTQAFVTWSDDSGKRQALSDTSDNIEILIPTLAVVNFTSVPLRYPASILIVR